MLPKELFKTEGFEWDSGNLEKNWFKHGVSPLECEEVFFNQPLIVPPDDKHSRDKARYFVLGRTDAARCLFVVGTLQRRKIRVISARDMNRKERKEYGA